MKKTLVALAVLAASGASMAQVTISGKFEFGFVATTVGKADATKATVNNSGLGVQTSEIFFSAKEDLGGGYGVSLKYGLAGLDRSGESLGGQVGGAYGTFGTNALVTGRNGGITLTSPVGALTLGTYKIADYLNAQAGLGLNIDDISDLRGTSLFSGRARRDFAQYDLPIGAFTLTAAHLEAGNDLGINDGSQGPNADQSGLAQRINVLGAGYSANGLVLNGQYLSYDNNWTPRNGLLDGNVDNVVRFGGSYNFGMAKVGAAMQIQKNTGDFKATQTLLTVGVPLGALDLGVSYGLRTVEGSKQANVNGDRNGYLLYAQYNLSKRTAVKLQYVDLQSSVAAGQENSNVTYMLLSHSF